MLNFQAVKKAILEENLSGWLFFNFRHRDLLADFMLNRDLKSINSRGWFYVILPDRENLKITHSVEPDALSDLPGETAIYTSRHELKGILESLSGKNLACQEDPELLQVSFLDSGTASFLRSCGINIASSASLVKKTIGVLDDRQILSHEKAAKLLYEITEESWDFLSVMFRAGKGVTEKMVQSFILERFEKNSLVSEHKPLVAFGTNTSDPHYETGSRDRSLAENCPVQLDIWAKCSGGVQDKNGKSGLNTSGGNEVYADISWFGFSGYSCTPEIRDAFHAVCRARDSVTEFIKGRLENGIPVSGEEADRHARECLEKRGFGSAIRHRTGHAIDLELHGYGVNLDSIEFPDRRTISPGSCFSVEPGLYFRDFGVRTEINCIAAGEKLVVTGKKPQDNVLLINSSH